MSYEIQLIDIRKPGIEDQLRGLIKESFKMGNAIPEGYLYNNVFTENASKESFFLAAVENGEILGCNGFISTDFIQNGKTFSCFQSCWSATHPKHQGKKIFVNIINEAKRMLKEDGAGFLYGVPNNNSHPIFVNKLGFIEIPSMMVKIPNIPILKASWLNKKINKPIDYFKTSAFCPVEDQIVNLKKRMSNGEIVEVSVNKSYLWGKLKTNKRFGVNFRYFYVGGIELANIHDFHLLIDQAFKKNIHYLQIVSCQSNRYNELLKNWKQAKINGFIFYELNSGPIENVNLMYGAIDVF